MADTCDISGCDKPAKNKCNNCGNEVCEDHAHLIANAIICEDCY